MFCSIAWGPSWNLISKCKILVLWNGNFMATSFCSPCLSDVSHVWLVQCTLDESSSAVVLFLPKLQPGKSSGHTENTEYSYGWDVFPAAPFTGTRRILMAVAGGTICTDIFEVRCYLAMFRIGFWSIDTLGHSADLKTQSFSLGFSEISILFKFFLRHNYVSTQ